MLQINTHIDAFTLSKSDVSSTIHITNLKEPVNHDTVFKALKYATQLNTIYRNECDTIGRLSLELAFRVSHEFGKHDKYAFMQFEPQLSGSILEKTKCYFPDECDVLCRLSHSNIVKHI